MVPEAVVDGRPLLYSAALGRILSKNSAGWLRRKPEVFRPDGLKKWKLYIDERVLIKSPTCGTFSNFDLFVLPFVSSQLPHTSCTQPWILLLLLSDLFCLIFLSYTQASSVRYFPLS